MDKQAEASLEMAYGNPGSGRRALESLYPVLDAESWYTLHFSSLTLHQRNLPSVHLALESLWGLGRWTYLC